MTEQLALLDVDQLDAGEAGRGGRIPSWYKMSAELLWLAWRDQFGSEDEAIATAVWMANRLAKDKARSSKKTFYSIKDAFIERYGSTGKRARREVQKCWGCEEGVTEWGEVCERCDGTGEYRARWLYVHEFIVAGQRYSLHSYAEPKILLDEPAGGGETETFGSRFTENELRALALPFSGLLKMLTYVAAVLWGMQRDNGAYR